jgi:integrase/recombinase XerD
MAYLKVILHPINKDREGKRAIVLRVTHLRVKFFVSLEIKDKLFETQFEGGQIKPTAGVSLYKQKNALIVQKLNEAHQILLDFDKKKIPFSIDRFKDQLGQKKSQDFVLIFLDQLVEKYANDKKPGNSGIYNTLRNSIFKFMKSNQLRFSDITLSFLHRYTTFLFGEGLSGNGISLYMRTLRSAYNKAIALGAADLSLYPFHNIQNPNGYRISQLETATPKRAIKLSDIREIEKISTKTYSMKHDAKLYFLFSFYCRGMNFTDMANLKPENCQSGRIIYTRAKTRNRKIFSVEILPPVQTIIEYFALHPLKANYLLPILDDKKHPTEKHKKTRIQSLLKKVNRDLKVLGTDAKINISLTTYVARHSWATIMKSKGTPTAVISEALGHPDEKTTQIYLEDFENSILDDANRKLLE